MSIEALLNETCDIGTISQAADPTNGNMVETLSIIFSDEPCSKRDLTQSAPFKNGKDSLSYTDKFYTRYDETLKSLDSKYYIIYNLKRYKVVKVTDPQERHHHLEIYAELST